MANFDWIYELQIIKTVRRLFWNQGKKTRKKISVPFYRFRFWADTSDADIEVFIYVHNCVDNFLTSKNWEVGARDQNIFMSGGSAAKTRRFQVASFCMQWCSTCVVLNKFRSVVAEFLVLRIFWSEFLYSLACMFVPLARNMRWGAYSVSVRIIGYVMLINRKNELWI